MNNHFSDKIQFIWSIAELLRGDYKRADYGKVVLPMTVLRRLDCVLEPTKAKVLAKYDELKKKGIKEFDAVLNREAKQLFHNRSKLDFQKLLSDPDKLADNLRAYINGFSASAREIINKFEFDTQIQKLDESNLLFLVVKRFCEIDLHPDAVSNEEMGYIFEELIRRFSEQSNETAGEHFTPREVIRLMVNLLFIEDKEILTRRGIVKSLFDPACGTGGMLSIADAYLREMNPDAELKLFGQELNDESYAICKSDMMIKGQEPDNIKSGNSFTKDGFTGSHYDYMLSNPPFGVEWKKVEKEIRDEAENLGFNGRFGAGLPRINDGSFLFLQHMISKMKPADNGTRLAIVFNGSPLFTGSAGSGESEIRKWIIESDMLEAIIAMPDQLFYNTGIFTYVWIVTNRKPKRRRGKIQLVNAVRFFEKMRKSLGNKRHIISDKQIAEITRLYGDFKEGKFVKIFNNEDFGYWRVTVERPLKPNFSVADDRLERLNELKPIQKLKEDKREAILVAIKTLRAGKLYKNRDEFTDALKVAFKRCSVTVDLPIFKSILSALNERDETADVCTDRSGNPEPDTELRDFENVPLKEDIGEYFRREVLPYVPDAWIDESKTKTGYELNFNRYFYEYKPPRPLEEIESEIKTLEKDIADMLKEV